MASKTVFYDLDCLNHVAQIKTMEEHIAPDISTTVNQRKQVQVWIDFYDPILLPLSLINFLFSLNQYVRYKKPSKINEK